MSFMKLLGRLGSLIMSSRQELEHKPREDVRGDPPR